MKRKWGKRNRARQGFPVFGDHMQRLPLNTLFSLVAIDFVAEEEMEKDQGKTTQNDDDLTAIALSKEYLTNVCIN